MKKDYAKKILNQTKEQYNLIAQHFSSAREKPWKEFYFLFDQFLSPGDKILDIGCGNGRFFELCQGQVSYFGIDNSEELIKIAQIRYPKGKYPEANFQLADALQLPFSDNYFDKVYSLAVLQHIPSQEFRQQFLKEVRRVLRPRGLLFLTVWNLWRWSNVKTLIKYTILKLLGLSKLDFQDFFLTTKKENSLFKNFYYHAFTKKELRRIVEMAGFKINDSGLIVMSSKKPHSNFYLVASKL